MGGGYIKIHRKLLGWQWIGVPEMVSVWIHLLMDAYYEPGEWKGVKIGRGQLTVGRTAYAVRCGISERQFRTCMERLKATSEITTKTTNKYTLVTICQYDLYQSNTFETTSTTTNEMANERPTNDQPTTTIKEVKNKRTKEDSSIHPELEDVVGFCKSENFKMNPTAWHDYYKSNGWKVGKVPMKDWKACVRNWERRELENKKVQPNEHHYRMES